MKWLFVSVSCLFAILRFMSAQTLYSNSENSIFVHLPEDVNREVRNVFFQALVRLQKDLNREFQVQNSNLTSYIEQTRTLLDIFKEQQQALQNSVSEMRNLRVQNHQRLEAMVNANEATLQRQLGNLSNALYKETKDFENLAERLSIVDEKFVNQSIVDRKIRKKLADLFNSQRSLLNTTSKLFTTMKVINNTYSDIEQNFTSRLNFTTFQLSQSLVEMLGEKPKECTCKRNISTGILSSLRNQSEEMEKTKESVVEIKEENRRLTVAIEVLQNEISSLKKNITISNDASSKQTSCPPAWTSFKNSCYMAVNQAKSWDNAAMKCIRYGAKLVEIETKDENDFLKNTLLKTTGTYWTGGIDDVTEGEWFWAVSGSSLNFTDWNTGEPNDTQKNEDCLELSKHRSRKKSWNDNRCNKSMKFICEKSAI